MKRFCGPPEERFMTKWEPVTESGCWIWLGALNGYGYGILRGADKKLIFAHRLSYEMFKGPIYEATLDHLCRVRCCVNPDHLEPVSRKVNTLRGYGITALNKRKTHCPAGHPYDNLNTRYKNTRRHCITCTRKWDLDKYYRKANNGKA